MKSIFLVMLAVLPAGALEYRRDVMPIFKAKCYDCHSSGARKVKGGLRLDDDGHFYKRFSKNDVVVPGDWDASYLFVTLVMSKDEKGSMPPKNKGEALTEKEIKLVAQWIHEGAKIDGKKGKKGPDKWDPRTTLKFKNGRIVTEQFVNEPKTEEPKWETWTNGEGKELIARFHGMSDDKVTLELKGGKKVEYPLEKLSKESQAKIKTLSKAAEGQE